VCQPPTPPFRSRFVFPAQALFARVEELFTPGVVLISMDPLPSAQLGDAAFSLDPFEHDPKFLLGRVLLSGPAFDVFKAFFDGALIAHRNLQILVYGTQTIT